MKEVYFDSVQKYNDYYGFETLHPLVSVVRMDKPYVQEEMTMRCGLYMIFLKENKGCKLSYGRTKYDFDEMLRGFDAAMPEGERLGEFLDSVEVPVGELKVGDEVYMFSHYDDWKAFPVVGFGQPEFNRISVWVDLPDGKKDVVYPDLPYVAWMDHDGDFSWNSNNYVHGPTARIKPRK